MRCSHTFSYQKPQGFSLGMNRILNGTSPHRYTSSVVPTLVLDVLLDDGQEYAAVGGGEVGRGSEVPMYEGAVDAAGGLLTE